MTRHGLGGAWNLISQEIFFFRLLAFMRLMSVQSTRLICSKFEIIFAVIFGMISKEHFDLQNAARYPLDLFCAQIAEHGTIRRKLENQFEFEARISVAQKLLNGKVSPPKSMLTKKLPFPS